MSWSPEGRHLLDESVRHNNDDVCLGAHMSSPWLVDQSSVTWSITIFHNVNVRQIVHQAGRSSRGTATRRSPHSAPECASQCLHRRTFSSWVFFFSFWPCKCTGQNEANQEDHKKHSACNMCVGISPGQLLMALMNWRCTSMKVGGFEQVRFYPL